MSSSYHSRRYNNHFWWGDRHPSSLLWHSLAGSLLNPSHFSKPLSQIICLSQSLQSPTHTPVHSVTYPSQVFSGTCANTEGGHVHPHAIICLTLSLQILSMNTRLKLKEVHVQPMDWQQHFSPLGHPFSLQGHTQAFFHDVNYSGQYFCCHFFSYTVSVLHLGSTLLL